MIEVARQPRTAGQADVDPASVGLVTLDTGSGEITSCNDVFAEVVGRRPADVLGCPISDFVDDEVRTVATAVIEGIRAGYISSVDGNVDLSGSSGSVGVDCRILALGTGRPRPTAIAGVIPAGGSVASGTERNEVGFRPAQCDPNRIVLATLDKDWRIVDVAPGSAGRLGLPAPTAPMPQLHELAHPAEASTLNGSLGPHTAADAPLTFTVRLRGADVPWLPTRLTVSALHGRVPAAFGLVVSPSGEGTGDADADRVARLEEQLARIRQVVQSTDGHSANGSIDLSDLTVRQREIVDRLLGGHRVDAIARDLYVSPSTVRNHLSAIFEKLGVASQSELVELLRGHTDGAGRRLEPDPA